MGDVESCLGVLLDGIAKELKVGGKELRNLIDSVDLLVRCSGLN